MVYFFQYKGKRLLFSKQISILKYRLSVNNL